jgi:hypothetical protein
MSIINPSQVIPSSTGMVKKSLFMAAIGELTSFGEQGTSVKWVNWRKDEYQIVLEWNNAPSFACYLSIKSATDRDALHKKLFELFANKDQKPFHQEGHGWSKMRYDFWSSNVISINKIADIADGMGLVYTIIYAQESISARNVFNTMQIGLVPGESGKELIQGTYSPYARETGKCL